MVGKKGRSGGARHTANHHSPKNVRIQYLCTQETATMIRQIAIATYGTDRYKTSRVLDEAVEDLFRKRVVNALPPNTRLGTYQDFRDHFLELYRPDLDGSGRPRDYFLSCGFTGTLLNAAQSKAHLSARTLEAILQNYDADIVEIATYYLGTYHLFFEKAGIVRHVLQYFTETGAAA